MHLNLTDKTKRIMISSYVNGTIKAKDISVVEEIVGADKVYRHYYERKVQERDFVLQMIPQEKMNALEKTEVLSELREVSQDLFGNERVPVRERIKDFLDKPFISLKF